MAPSQLDRIESKLDEIHRTLHVDDGPSNPCFGTRLDRIEQCEARRAWVVRTALGAAVTAAVASVYTFFAGGKP